MISRQPRSANLLSNHWHQHLSLRPAYCLAMANGGGYTVALGESATPVVSKHPPNLHRFGSAPSQIPSVPQIVVHAPTVPPQQSAPSTPHLREIGDLCSEITACTGKPSCLGSLIDRDQGGSYSVFAQPDQRITADAVTLEAVIQGSFKPRLTRVQRYSVALVVASSHLQLHSTPWARKQWDARSISFPRDDADPKKVSEVHLTA